MKICTKCKKEKELNDFWKDKYTKTGKTFRCKECLRRYKPEEIRCHFCHEWFTKKQKNQIFCNPKCSSNYWNRIWRIDKGYWHRKETSKLYYQQNTELILEKVARHYSQNRERILRRRKERRKYEMQDL